jgi:beta-glucosidase
MPNVRRLLRLSVIAASVVLTASLAQAQSQPPAYLDPALPTAQRIDDLISRMTLEEKAKQLVHPAAGIARLNVPEYNWWSEGLHGVAFAGTATVFPEPIGLAATFDTPLIHDMATVISTEARAKHHQAVREDKRFIMYGLTFWSPNVNIFRDPRWGRGQETYGEDPFLSARMGVAFVDGMQGDDPKYLRVVATPKHYAVHSGPEPLRHTFDAVVSRHDMQDTYLPAFRATVVESRAGSVMCAYNSVNGQPACANDFLLRETLRDAWKFQGYVVSDCGAVSDFVRGHHFTRTPEEEVAAAIKAGTDLECADGPGEYIKYVNAVDQGLLPEREIDTALRRLFAARFALGVFDPPAMVPFAQIPYSENDSEAHRKLALQAARETMVLLKNDGVLPLKPTLKKIAVVGPLADQIRVLEGNYAGTPSRATTALEGIRAQFKGAQVTFVPGTGFLRGGIPVPGSALTTPDGKPGLKAEYFQGTELQGTPVEVRVDANIDNEFGSSPAAGLGAENFSARWTGFLTPAESGTYQLGVIGDDGFRLWFDGKMVVEDWTTHGAETKTATVQLEKGHRYAIKMEYFQGGGGAVAKLVWSPQRSDDTAEAVAAAKAADVVIAVVGITSDLEGEEMKVETPGFKGGDRTTLDLPKQEEDLLKAVKAAGKPLIVVLMNGSALSVNWASQNANAILEAWYSGEEGGTAVAETLAGVNNRAGRLPVTFYTGIDQLPPFEDYAMKGRTYRYFEGKPLYPFGYGLSYSTFAYKNLKLSSSKLNPGDSLTVKADVTNTSKVAGDEVVQVYLEFPKVPGAPLRALRGFTRVHLAPGESRHVPITLRERDLSMVNDAGYHIVAPGPYRVSIGSGQPLPGANVLQSNFTITGERRLPD